MFDPKYPMILNGPMEVEDITTNPGVHHPILPVETDTVEDPAYIYQGKIDGECRKDDVAIVMNKRKNIDNMNQEKYLEEKRQEQIQKEKELKALYGGIDVEAYFKKHAMKGKNK